MFVTCITGSDVTDQSSPFTSTFRKYPYLSVLKGFKTNRLYFYSDHLMRRKINVLVLTIISMLVSQSCSTIKSIWSDVKELPSKFHQTDQYEVGYPGVPTIMVPDTSKNTSITGFVSITKHTVYGNDKWYDPVGLQAGVIYPFYRINDKIDLRAEANLSMQGAKWEGTDTKGRTNLLYINAPVVARYQFDFGFFAEAGIQPGFLVSAKKYEGTVDNIIVNMRKIDLSFPLGIGYEFKSNFGVGLRVIPGITDITRYAAGNDRNLVIALRGTYNFRIK